MRSFLVTLLLIAVIGIAGYLYLKRDGSGDTATSPPSGAPPPPEIAPPTKPDSTLREAPTPADPTLDSEAREYVRDLTTLNSQPLSAADADNFVQRDQQIGLLPSRDAETTTPQALQRDPSLKPETPLTVIREVDQIEILTAEKLRATKGSDPTQPLRVLEENEVRDTTVAETLARHAEDPDAPITIVRRVEEVEQTTVGQLAQDTAAEPDKPVKVLKGHQSLEAATVAELMMHSGESDADSIYYVRTVRDTDSQGIWGIIQYGLIENFGRGIAIRRGESVDTYRVDIPRDADERIDATTSSFLGRIIDDKTRSSYVYNMRQARMGKNPDMILPGQELLIIRFTPEELVDIYKHFVTSGPH
jgi:hypothetical protein